VKTLPLSHAHDVPFSPPVDTPSAHQGRIDSARLFSTKFGRDCAKLAGMRRYLWDPQPWTACRYVR
jgi:hypothetical protein